MFRIWLLLAGLVLGTAFRVAAHDEKQTETEGHDDASVKLTEHQVDAGKFAVADVAGGVLSKRIAVPGSIVPRRLNWSSSARCEVASPFRLASIRALSSISCIVMLAYL
jgi:hypothetical protein